MVNAGLLLGDIIFDPRRVIFVRSLRTIVCLGLKECHSLDKIFLDLSECQQLYKADTFILIGVQLNSVLLLRIQALAQSGVRIQIVAKHLTDIMIKEAEDLGFEVHSELVWGKYRFAEAIEIGTMELYFLSAIGGTDHSDSDFAVRVGRASLVGMKLPVFLKGLGHVILPQLDPHCKKRSVFRRSLARYDAFAVGHHRVFPLGKIADLKEVRSLGSIPLSRSTLGSKRAGARK